MPAARGSARAAAALAALTLAVFCYVTAENLPIGLLPLLADDLDVPLPLAGRLVTGYGLTVAATAVPLALATRRIPRRYLLTGLLAVLTTATLVSVTAANYWVLLGARIATALTQASFWGVVAPTAAGLFPPAVRGRIIATLFAGGSIASIAGIPAGTWLGQQAGWRAAFVALGVLGLVTLLAVAALLPTVPAQGGTSATGSTPSGRRYAVMVVSTALTTAGAFTAYTYIATFLTEVSGFPAGAIGPILMLGGVAGAVGNVVIGIVFDRSPRLGHLAPVALLGVALLGLFLLGSVGYAGAAATMLWGMSVGAFSTALQSRILMIAPGRTDLASAGNAAAFSFGTACGAGLGGTVLASAGIVATAGAGALLVAVALTVLLCEPLVASAGR